MDTLQRRNLGKTTVRNQAKFEKRAAQALSWVSSLKKQATKQML